MLSAARRIRCLPTGVEPVKLTLRISLLAISVRADQVGIAMDQLGNALGNAGVGQRAEHLGRAARRFVRRARDDGAAGGQRGGDLLGEQIDREIPRGEGRDRARPAGGSRATAGPPGGPACGHSRA